MPRIPWLLCALLFACGPSAGDTTVTRAASPPEPAVPGGEIVAAPGTGEGRAALEARAERPRSDPAPNEVFSILPVGDGVECVRLESRRLGRDGGSPRRSLTGRSQAIDLEVRGTEHGDDVLVHSYRFTESTPGGARGAGGDLGLQVVSGPGVSVDVMTLHPDRPACERALGEDAASALPPRVQAAFERFRDGDAGPEWPEAGDPLLERMRARERVWIFDGVRCRPWRLAPSENDPAAGSLRRRHREPDGSRVTTSYGYRYRRGRMALTGPGGRTLHPDGSESGWGRGCLETASVEHEPGATRVGAATWHYSPRACASERREALRRQERDEVASGRGVGGC